MRLLPTALPILAATWLYDFTWRSPRLGACHTLDVRFTFGDADTGDPGWPRFDLEHPRTRILDTPPRVPADPLADSRRIWEHVSGR